MVIVSSDIGLQLTGCRFRAGPDFRHNRYMNHTCIHNKIKFYVESFNNSNNDKGVIKLQNHEKKHRVINAMYDCDYIYTFCCVYSIKINQLVRK